MPTTDPRIDAYLRKASPFAQPILTAIRARVHAACPAAVETVKWGFPHFDYAGKILCSMAAFKAHCALTIWARDEFAARAAGERDGMGQFGKLTRVDELPPAKELTRRLRAAMKAIDAGEPAYSRPRTPKPPLVVPKAFLAAVKKNAKAQKTFAAFTEGHRRAYVEWVTAAKTAPTREKRLAQAVTMMAEGKGRNWKYER